MLRMKTRLLTLALMGVLAPLAANARALGGHSHPPAQKLILVSNPLRTPAFSAGRMAELPARGMTANHETMRYALVNTGAAQSATGGIGG